MIRFLSFIFGSKNEPARAASGARGFGLIEALVVAAVVGAALAGLFETGILALRLLHTEQQNLEAAMLAAEGLEAVRAVRDESWTSKIAPLLTDGTPYYPEIINGTWSLSTAAPLPINGVYTRSAAFAAVCRNGLDDIAPCGTPDSDTKRVTVTVAWGSGKQRILTSYITNFQSKLNLPAESVSVSYAGASTDTDVISFPSNNAGDGDPAQSFTTLASALKVTRVDAYLRRTTASPSNVYAEIRTSPTGAVLGASNLITASTITTSAPSWVAFRFSPAVPLAASTLYYLRLRSIPSSTQAGSGSQGAINWVWGPFNPYGGGAGRRYIEKTGPGDQGQALGDDFGFRVYSLP